MTPWVKRLLIANVVVFFFTQSTPRLAMLLAFYPSILDTIPRPWTPFTYMFVHANLGPIFFNMLGLFFFGPRLEARLGSKHFLMLWVLSGLGGAALTLLFGDRIPIVGASGALFGVFLGFAMFWPREQIYIWGIIPIQARVLVALMTGLSLYAGFGGISDGIAHFGHLGGFVGGFLFLKWIEMRSPSRQFKKKAYAHVAPNPAKDPGHLRRWQEVDREQLHEVNRAEFDRLMAKIEGSGMNSLTLDERAFLDRFSA
jgi:membrane associated rhomboid family serine protease